MVFVAFVVVSGNRTRKSRRPMNRRGVLLLAIGAAAGVALTLPAPLPAGGVYICLRSHPFGTS